MFFLCSVALGQSEKPVIRESLPAKQKDFVDILDGTFKFHLRKDSALLKSNKPLFSIIPIIGYSLQSGFTGALVTNTSFYTDSSRNKFSNIILNGYYSEYHQYWFICNTNIFLDKLKLHLSGDARYYKFPTNTFGLGTRSSLADALAIEYSYLRIYQIVFRELVPNLFAGIGYNLDYHWNISTSSVPGRALAEFDKLEKGTRSVSSGISLNAQFDNRKNSVNPQNGTYVNVQYRPNLTLLGSDQNWQSLLIDVRHYIKLPASSRNVLALWYYSNITVAGTPPYLDLPSIGWDDYSNTGRGYVPGRFTGRNLLYAESEYRFPLTQNGLLGGVVFGNAESVLRNISSKIHTVIPGGGFGLRIKMNKYSNTNVAIDYGFGVGGSHGLFFNLGEVF
ncbi:MAG: BamA/TamA family outer membrane protein [Bacteroidota bacterium]|nr:BamA/TamA family outer membrane protein [Bacteroidota bacterium]